MSADRHGEVYPAIDAERAYQIERWAESATKGSEHSVTEFLVFMRDYVEQALHVISREPEPAASRAALHAVRKVTALGVACMERHGVPVRPVVYK